MAQASSAQREPSMEEILASIRRIIEDSDTGRKPGDEVDPGRYDFSASRHEPVAAEPAGRPFPESTGSPVIEVDAFRAELRSGHSEPTKPVTLAEVQARIAAEAPMSAETPAFEAEPEPAAKVEEEFEIAEAPAAHRLETPFAPAPEAERDFSPSPHDGSSDFEESTSIDDAMLNAVFDDIAAEQASSTPEQVKTPPSHAEGGFSKPAIISEHAGRQVAAAFEELSEAFAARSKKTFDDMAEEMMRPMLQDWLDNNLPTLVERLVREEIERVARGAS
ncbi:MAG: DUF2497 domain-containing protein [Pseudaminobacter sp.]|nr:DUF2497 domain-containing protein [Pseudaminobacter sp.]